MAPKAAATAAAPPAIGMAPEPAAGKRCGGNSMMGSSLRRASNSLAKFGSQPERSATPGNPEKLPRPPPLRVGYPLAAAAAAAAAVAGDVPAAAVPTPGVPFSTRAFLLLLCFSNATLQDFLFPSNSVRAWLNPHR